MKETKDNVIACKSMAFAIRMVKLYKYLQEEKREYCLSKQVLRSGTSIGANVREAIRGQTRGDFRAKMNISLKEASETEYWLELLQATDYLSESAVKSLLDDCHELIRLLTAIIKTAQNNMNNA
jgi:four helix bundle protein